MTSGRKWTQDDDDFIRKCIAEGTNAEYCARKLGVSRNSVIGHAGRIGLHFVNLKSGRKLWPARYG